MVSLLQCLFTQSPPDIFLLDDTSLLERDWQVAAFDGEIEPGHRILYEVQGNLGIALLLEITDDTLANQVGRADDLENLVVVLLDQRQLESILCRINGDGSGLCLTIQAVNSGTLDSSQVYRLFQRLDNTVIPVDD